MIVNFDNNETKWVFWRGLGFVPSIVSENGAWFSNEFNESWGWPQMCDSGGAEPMNDKQARYSHVRVIENTPARVVVHWRYHPTGICYNLIDTENSPDNWGSVSDFIFYIYPDGSTLSKNTLHSQQVNTYGGSVNGFEYHEAMIINSAGKDPWDNIDIQNTVSIFNLAGESATYSGANGGINSIGDEPFPLPIKGNISRINLKDTPYDTYTVMEHGGSLEILPYWEMDFNGEYPNHHFVRWNHWPVNQIRAFGRSATAANYPSHTSLIHMAFNPPFDQGDTWQTRLLLTGVSDMSDSQVVSLAHSWIHAPSVENVQGAQDGFYDESQRAYQFKANKKELSFTLNGSVNRPVFNPAFSFANWQGSDDAKITVNGSPVPSAKKGVIRNSNGQKTLQLFIPLQSQSPVKFSVFSG